MAAGKVRCGVVGVGYLGKHHARLYAALDDAELVGVVDSNAKAAEAIAKEHGTQVYPDAARLAGDCDALSIVTPTPTHAEVAQEVLSHDCHVLVEKPLCTSMAEAEAILSAAKKAGKIVQVGHIEHFNPVMNYLETVVDDPRYITADRIAPFNPRGTEVGVVLDLMIHDIGIILQLVKSPVERIDSIGVPILTKHEDIANARITFANGAVANLNTSRVSLKKVREIRVFQPSAYLSLNFMDQSGHLIRKNGLSIHREDIPIDKDEPLKLELAAFLRAVRGYEPPKVDGELGRSALEVAMRVTEGM